MTVNPFVNQIIISCGLFVKNIFIHISTYSFGPFWLYVSIIVDLFNAISANSSFFPADVSHQNRGDLEISTASMVIPNWAFAQDQLKQGGKLLGINLVVGWEENGAVWTSGLSFHSSRKQHQIIQEHSNVQIEEEWLKIWFKTSALYYSLLHNICLSWMFRLRRLGLDMLIHV